MWELTVYLASIATISQVFGCAMISLSLSMLMADQADSMCVRHPQDGFQQDSVQQDSVRQYSVAAGDSLIIAPSCRHRWQDAPHQPLRLVVCCFSKDGLGADVTEAFPQVVHRSQHTEAAALAHRILGEYAQRPIGWSTACRTAVMRLLVQWLREDWHGPSKSLQTVRRSCCWTDGVKPRWGDRRSLHVSAQPFSSATGRGTSSPAVLA